MGKLVDDTVWDTALQFLEDQAILLTVCKDTPATYGEATTSGTYMLAQVVVSAADFTIANGATGRKTTIAEQAAIEILATGSATHVCLCSDDTLLFVTTCDAQVLTDGNAVTVPEWSITISDPT